LQQLSKSQERRRPLAGRLAAAAARDELSATLRTETWAVRPTERLERQASQDILPEHFGQIENVVLIDCELFGLRLLCECIAGEHIDSRLKFFTELTLDYRMTWFQTACAELLDFGAVLAIHDDPTCSTHE
jgi:hypothetical protein